MMILDEPVIQANHKKLWLTLIVSSVFWEKKDMVNTVKDLLAEKLKVHREIISVYYIYSKQTSEFFFYEELYVYIDCASRFRSTLIQSFRQHEEEIMNVLKKELNKEAVLKIIDIHSLENRRFLVCLYYVLPILFIIICCVSFYAVFSYRRKEAQDNMYLLSYNCLLKKKSMISLDIHIYIQTNTKDRFKP